MSVREIHLRRSGKPPLRFEGELVASATSRRVEAPGKDSSSRGADRRYDLEVYRIDGPGPNRFAWSIRYEATGKGEFPLQSAGVAADDRELAAAFRSYNPLAGVRGTMGSNSHPKQIALNQAMCQAYGNAASDLFDALGYSECPGDATIGEWYLAGWGDDTECDSILELTGGWRPVEAALRDRRGLMVFLTPLEAEAAQRALRVVVGDDSIRVFNFD